MDAVDVPCPVCRAAAGRPCDYRWVASHGRRWLVLIARHLVRMAMPASDDPGLQTRVLAAMLPAIPFGPEASPPADRLVELGTYQDCEGLVRLAAAAVSSYHGRTLNLVTTARRLRRLGKELQGTVIAARMRHDGLRRPPDGDQVFGRPTRAHVDLWAQLHELADIRSQVQERHALAATLAPDTVEARWTVKWFRDGCLRATRETDALTVTGWAVSPELAGDVLRQWSASLDCKVAVSWRTGTSPRQRSQPPGVTCHYRSVHGPVRAEEQWHADRPANEARLAAAQREIRLRLDIDQADAVLAEEAERLNTEEPPSPGLVGALQSENLRWGCHTETTGWVDPRHVAHVRLERWNGFADHRPEAVRSFAELLLSADPAELARQFCYPFGETVDLYRVPGPAGPLYELGGDGTHRLHAARLLGFGPIWANVRQVGLPLTLTARNALPAGYSTGDVSALLHRWRSLLDRGLAHGEVVDDEFPTLRLAWVLAPWLLLDAGRAVAWCQHYERIFPGALAAAGIPPQAWLSEAAWCEWLR